MSTVSNPETFLSPQDLTTPAASVAASSITGSQAQTLQMPSKDSSKIFFRYCECTSGENFNLVRAMSRG